MSYFENNPNPYIMNTELASDTKTIYYTVNMVISTIRLCILTRDFIVSLQPVACVRVLLIYKKYLALSRLSFDENDPEIYYCCFIPQDILLHCIYQNTNCLQHCNMYLCLLPKKSIYYIKPGNLKVKEQILWLTVFHRILQDLLKTSLNSAYCL